MADLIVGLYARLVTEELSRLFKTANSAALAVEPADVAEAHVLVAEHAREILLRTPRSIPEEERARRQAELCDGLIAWLRDGHDADLASGDDALVVPLTVLREVRALTRGAALSAPDPTAAGSVVLGRSARERARRAFGRGGDRARDSLCRPHRPACARSFDGTASARSDRLLKRTVRPADRSESSRRSIRDPPSGGPSTGLPQLVLR